MFQVAPDTKLGVSYRSSIKYHLTGTANISPPGAPFASADVNTDIKMPDSASIAVQHRLNPGWTLLADVSRTGWAKIKDLTINLDSGGPASTENSDLQTTARRAA